RCSATRGATRSRPSSARSRGASGPWRRRARTPRRTSAARDRRTTGRRRRRPVVKARRTTDPASEPLTLEEAKAHLKVEVAADDAYITALITAARMTLEEWTGRAFIEQVWEARLDAFPCGDAPIVLPRPPLIAVSLISYIDPNGDQ